MRGAILAAECELGEPGLDVGEQTGVHGARGLQYNEHIPDLGEIGVGGRWEVGAL